MKSSAVNGVQQLKATFLNRPLTWAETRKMGDDKLPFTVVYNFRIVPYYHCVVFGGYLKDSLSIKLIDPDRINNTAFYFKSYKALTTGVLGRDDIWAGTVIVEKPTAVNPLSYSSNRHKGIDINYSGSSKAIRFMIDVNDAGNNSYKVMFYNSRGTSVYSIIADAGKHYSITPTLAQGLYVMTATPLNKKAENQNITTIFHYYPLSLRDLFYEVSDFYHVND
jgi:hypothetical protein